MGSGRPFVALLAGRLVSRSPDSVQPAKFAMTVRLLKALLVVLSIALVAVVVIAIFGDGDSSSPPEVGVPTAVSASALSDFAGEHATPVYWLGERPEDTYELTDAGSGRIYVRYLPKGVEVGDKRAKFVTVATYSQEGGVLALRKAAAEEKGAKLGKTDDGAVLLIDPASPKNAHLAYPGADVQIEVYSPVPGEALRLSARGAVQPVH